MSEANQSILRPSKNEDALTEDAPNKEGLCNTEITLSDIVRGIQHSVSTLHETSQSKFEEFLNRFFINKDEVLFPKNITVNLGDGAIKSIPLLTLFPNNFVSLSKVTIEFNGEIASINPKQLSPEISRASISIKSNNNSNPIKIATEFIASDPTESFARLIDSLSDTEHTNGRN